MKTYNPFEKEKPIWMQESLVAWYDVARQNVTNEEMKKNPILKDLSGNGYDLDCINFDWGEKKENSSQILNDGLVSYAANNSCCYSGDIKSLPILEDYTVFLKIDYIDKQQIENHPIVTKRKGNQQNGAFVIGNKYIYSFPDSNGDPINVSSELLNSMKEGIFLTKDRINNKIELKAGTGTDSDILLIGAQIQDLSQTNPSDRFRNFEGFVLYSLMLFDRTLTEEEIEFIKIEYWGPDSEFFILQDNPVYKSSVFSRFFEENDPAVMKWAENVLAKVSGSNILPKFIEKGGKDFQSFWGTITHLFALIVLYSRKYKEIDTNQILFELFIENRGLVSNLVTSQDQMQYLFYNYIKEYEKRGRLDIVNKEGVILGELLRLIRYNDLDEFIFAVLRPQDVSWAIGFSSPCWKRTNTVSNVTKGYEFTESIVDLKNYPLLRSSNVRIANDINNEDEIISSMVFGGSQKTGIYPTEDKSKLLVVDPALNYEVSIRVKLSSLINSKIQFGVICYDKDYNVIETQYIENGEYQLSDDSLFHSTEYLELVNENLYYNLTGIILAYNERNYDAIKLNFPSGRALSFLPNTKFICPVFVQNREANEDPNVYIYDVKVRPLELPFKQGCLGGKNVIAAYYKNNAFQSENSIETFIKQYLISYKNILKGIFIKDKSERKITFKVFSERNNYIQDATITIAGQTLKTDINGEAFINLYPGEYVYSIEKGQDFEIEEDILTIEDVDYIKYVQLKGRIYQRTISFLVLDEAGRYLKDAWVIFNQQTQITGENGLVLFEAYPGLYTYTVEKYDYISVSNTISVVDSTNITVELNKVPYYTVTIRVREGFEPIANAAVVLTGDFDGSGQTQQYTGTTNAQGTVNQTSDGNPFLMRAGTYHYLVSKKDYFTKESDFNIINNATINVDLTAIPYYNVNFTVLRDGVPVDNASISIDNNTLVTDNKGKASISFPNGTYSYKVSKTGYIEKSGTVIVNDADQNLTIDVTAIEYNINFIVTDEKSNPLIGAVITIGTERQTTTALGAATFKRIVGEYNYSISLANYNTYTGIVVISNKDEQLNIKMSNIQYEVRFVVRSDGNPIEGVSVKCGDRDSILTNRNGEAIFNFASGNYPFSITKEGFERYDSTVEVGNRNTVVPVDLTLSSNVVTFYVRNESGEILSNAAIIINKEVHYTTEEGLASFLLSYGDYHYTVEADGYNYNWGDIRVTNEALNVNVTMYHQTTTVYVLKFTITQESNPAVGALVTINGNIIGYANSEGVVSFNLPNGDYRYTVSNGDFINQTEGNRVISGSNSDVSVNLTRKTTNVTFNTTYIPNPSNPDEKLPVQDVSITFNGSTIKTNQQGKAVFSNVPLSLENKEYRCSKKPPYEDIVRNTTITTENPEIDVVMGESTYSIIFIVVDELGNPIPNAYISCGGQVGNTNPLNSSEPGRLTLRGYGNNLSGYYYTISKEGYQTISGNAVVQNESVFITKTLKRSYTEITFKVQTSDGLALQGASIQIGELNEATDSHGEVLFLVTEQKTYNYKVTYPHCMDSSGSFTNDLTSKTVTVTIEDTMAIVVRGSGVEKISLPILNTNQEGLSNLKVDWGDGTITYGKIFKESLDISQNTEIKISFGSEIGTLRWSCEEAPLLDGIQNKLRYVERFFQNTNQINFGNGGFYKCILLSRLDKLRVGFVQGSCVRLFANCLSLNSIEPGMLDWAKLGDFTKCFANSGLIEVRSGLIENIETVLYLSKMFEDCKSLESVTIQIPSTCTSASAMFKGCSNLQVVSDSIFQNASGLTNASEMFDYTSKLQQMPRIEDLTANVNCNAMFRSSGFSNFRGGFPRNCINADEMFENSQLSSMFAVIESSNLTTLDRTFMGCGNLGTITNIDLRCSNVTSVQFLFSGTGVNSIPSNYFSRLTNCVNFAGVFQNCKNLQYIYGEKESSPFFGCPVESLNSAFSGCSNLRGDFYYLFYSYAVTRRRTQGGNYWKVQGVSAYCKDYSFCFEGCSSLTGESCCSELDDERKTFMGWLTALWGFTNGYIPAENMQASSYNSTLYTSKRTGCYRGCVNLSDYNDIPSDWK